MPTSFEWMMRPEKSFMGTSGQFGVEFSPVAIINSSHSTLTPEFSVPTTHRLPSALRETFETPLVLSLNLSMSENFLAYMLGDSKLIARQIRPIFQSDDLP
jgi:hypothetical protein